MNDNLNELVKQCVDLYNHEVENAFEALLCFGGCLERKDAKKIQIELANNGYDIVMCNFKNDNYKTFIYLTDLKNKFIKGYLVEFNFDTGKISRELIKGKVRFENIIKNV